MSGMRNAKGLCLSQNAKQPDFDTFQMATWLSCAVFLDMVNSAARFFSKHLAWFQHCFEARHDASQKKCRSCAKKRQRITTETPKLPVAKELLNKSQKIINLTLTIPVIFILKFAGLPHQFAELQQTVLLLLF